MGNRSIAFHLDGLWSIVYALLVILSLSFLYAYFRMMWLIAHGKKATVRRIEESVDRLYKAFQEGNARQALVELNALKGEIKNA